MSFELVLLILWVPTSILAILSAARSFGGGYQGSGDTSNIKPPKVQTPYLKK